jgi:hypothetical protein
VVRNRDVEVTLDAHDQFNSVEAQASSNRSGIWGSIARGIEGA